MRLPSSTTATTSASAPCPTCGDAGGSREGQSHAPGVEPGGQNADRPVAARPPTKEDVGWRKVVRNFTPSWFSVNMGTGIVSLLLWQLPYVDAAWVRYVAAAFFALNVALFTLFTIITILRYALYPEIWSAMIRHPTQSLFLGCFPMGLATIINMIVLACSQWGAWAVYMAWGLWWLDVALALACCMLIPLPVMHHHKLELRHVTATLLLPFVPAVVASSTGGLVATALPHYDRDHAVTTLLVSYALWGMGQSFAGAVTVVYLHRLCVHSLPPREAIVSVFLPVGPLGQGGFAIQQLGVAARELNLSSLTDTAFGGSTVIVGDVLYGLGQFFGLVMWGAGLCWLGLALVSIASTVRPLPFNMGWWGFTFPLGVLATCTGMLARELGSSLFRVLTMVFSVSVFALWLVVALRTALMAVSGDIFFAPCLYDLRPKTAQAGGDRTA